MFRGELDRLHLGDILQWLTLGNLSGRLTLTGTGYRRNFDFLDGRIVFASSEHPVERLGTWLAATGRADADELRRCLGLSLFRRALFTDVLVERSIVTSDALRGAVTELAQILMTRLILSPHLRFKFDDSFPVRDLLGLDLDLDPHQLLLEAARRSDELRDRETGEDRFELPLSGELFEEFFRQVIRDGVTADEPVDGEVLEALHARISMVTSMLGTWLETSPGLVPLPARQASQIAQSVEEGEPLPMYGAPHTVWDRMVIACSVRDPATPGPEAMDVVKELTGFPELGPEMVSNETWTRAEASRLDQLTAVAAGQWALLAKVASPHLGVDPQASILAAHLLVVPSDLVLWVLSTVPVPHGAVGRAVLYRLAQRVGAVLSSRADFPGPFHELFTAHSSSPMALCLHLAKEYVASSSVWLDPIAPWADVSAWDVPGDALERASEAIRAASKEMRTG